MQTLNDPKRREFGKLVYVTSDKKVLLQNRPEIGDEISVNSTAKIHTKNGNITLPWFLRQDKLIGTQIHSHPNKIPTSSYDLFHLLTGDFDMFAFAAVFVVTPQKNIVIFRGEGAPQFTHDQANEKITLWERQMTERVERFATSDTPRSENIEINSKARWALLRQIAQKYKLRVFSGDAKSTKVSLQ